LHDQVFLVIVLFLGILFLDLISQVKNTTWYN